MPRSARSCRLLVAATLLVAPMASAVPIDDFSDGNDDGWTHLTYIVSGLPAIFDASSGRYQMTSTGIVAENDTGIVARWEDSATNPVFANGTLSAHAQVDTENTSATLLLRGNGVDSAYVFSLNNALDKLFILAFGPTRSQCGPSSCFSVLASLSLPISEDTDYILRASAFGSTLGFSAWEASGTAPQEAQIVATDSELAEGAFGLSIARYAVNPPTAPISGSFDNVTFEPVPEPTTALLLALGLASLGMRRRLR